MSTGSTRIVIGPWSSTGPSPAWGGSRRSLASPSSGGLVGTGDLDSRRLLRLLPRLVTLSICCPVLAFVVAHRVVAPAGRSGGAGNRLAPPRSLATPCFVGIWGEMRWCGADAPRGNSTTVSRVAGGRRPSSPPGRATRDVPGGERGSACCVSHTVVMRPGSSAWGWSGPCTPAPMVYCRYATYRCRMGHSPHRGVELTC